MIRIYIRKIEIERAVHEINQEDMDAINAYLEETGEDLETVLLEGEWDDCPITEWYYGLYSDCGMSLEDDSISLIVDDVEAPLPLDRSTIKNTNFSLHDILSQEGTSDATHIIVAEHISKGGYYADLDIQIEEFDATKLVFYTRTYVGEFMYSDRMLVGMEYNGEGLEVDCDGTTGKSFEVSVFDIPHVRNEEVHVHN